MSDLETAKLRREELIREAERDRLVKELKKSRKRRSSERSFTLAWELRRGAGRLRKLLKKSRKAG